MGLKSSKPIPAVCLRQSFLINMEESVDEMVLEVPLQEALSMFDILSRLKVEVVATNYFIAVKTCEIWIKDTGFRLKNLFFANMLGSQTRMISKSKGMRKLMSSNYMTTYQFFGWIQTLRKEGLDIISHSPLEASTQKKFVYF